MLGKGRGQLEVLCRGNILPYDTERRAPKVKSKHLDFILLLLLRTWVILYRSLNLSRPQLSHPQNRTINISPAQSLLAGLVF